MIYYCPERLPLSLSSLKVGWTVIIRTYQLCIRILPSLISGSSHTSTVCQILNVTSPPLTLFLEDSSLDQFEGQENSTLLL